MARSYRYCAALLRLRWQLALRRACHPLVSPHRALADAFTRLRLFPRAATRLALRYLKSMASDVRAASENRTRHRRDEKLIFAWSTFSTDARRRFSRLYIAENAHIPRRAYKLVTPSTTPTTLATIGPSTMGQALPRAFRLLRRLSHQSRGDILYTVAKESDFATNLKTGPYRIEPAAESFAAPSPIPPTSRPSPISRSMPEQQRSCRLRRLTPSESGSCIGVFAVQIPAEPLNALMHFTPGIGESGETYLVGSDGLMRSQSRFSDEPTLLATKVENASVRDGLRQERRLYRARLSRHPCSRLFPARFRRPEMCCCRDRRGRGPAQDRLDRHRVAMIAVWRPGVGFLANSPPARSRPSCE